MNLGTIIRGSIAAFAAASFAVILGIIISAVPARAADLGGNCCSDLEERVAELEATVARKGNRKVTLEVYGQVSRSIMWIDGGLQDATIGDNANSPTRFGFRGSTKLSADIKAGYVIEYGAGGATPALRHSAVWIETLAGKLTLGHTSAATDQISEISLVNTNVANLPSVLYGGLVDGDRRNVIRYDTPSIAGFIASASWSADDVWDAALRYSGEGGGFRFSAGIGYSEDLVVGKRVSGSASLLHIQTGLFLNGVYGKTSDLIDVKVMHLTGGVQRNWFGIGATTMFGEYGKLDGGTFSGDGWGLGAVQAIDAGALDLFVSYRNIEDISIIHAGTRIQF